MVRPFSESAVAADSTHLSDTSVPATLRPASSLSRSSVRLEPADEVDPVLREPATPAR